MADKKKRYILKNIINNVLDSSERPFENNLVRLSAMGIKWDQSLIRNMRGFGAGEDNMYQQTGISSAASEFMQKYNRVNSIVGENDYIAFYDKNYVQRRDFLRKFSMQGEIEFATNTISDDAIVYDDNNYFAYPNTKVLYSHLKPERGKEIIDNLNTCYKKVYNAWKFGESNDAWHYMNKFLVDGILAFEIIYNHDNNNVANDIIGFNELDVTKLEPDVKRDDNGNEYKIWKLTVSNDLNGVTNVRELPDANVIYISWSKSNFIQRISYVEHLVRSFNMLRTLENSRVIWNVQNAQKNLKIVVPMGSANENKMRDRLNQLKAEFKEDVSIDELSGEITVNGQPKFNFAKTFLFPSSEGQQVDISEIAVQGHDLSNTEQLKFFWQKFILESKIPSARFSNLLGNQTTVGIPGSSENQNREEYSYNLFIKRCRNIFKELLIKPTWNLFCIKYPEFNTNTLIRSLFGLSFVEDNIYTLAKMRQNAQAGADVISSLSSLTNPDGSPYFSMRFLTEKYLGLSDDDYKLNDKYIKQDKELFKTTENSNIDRMDGGLGGGFNSDNFNTDFGGGNDNFSENEIDNSETIDNDFGEDFNANDTFAPAENDLE